MATVSSVGGGSIDVNSLVTQLMQVESQPLTKLQKTQATYQAKISAYGILRSTLSTFQDTVKNLGNVNNLQPIKASITDSSIATVSATSSATPGTYSLEVSKLAQQQKLNSTAFASSSATVGTGTLTIQLGTYNSSGNTFTANPDKSAVSVAITGGSLSSIRDSINNANAGVSANIVNDGTGSRLVLTSKDTGAANSIKLTVADDDGTNTNTSGLSALAFDPTVAAGSGKNLTQNQAAQNAAFTLDGISISKASNNITDAIDGITLNLTKVTTSAVSLNVTRDTSTLTNQVQSLVQAFNTALGTLKQLSSSDPTTKQVGALAGDSSVSSALTQLRSLLTTQLGSESGTYTSLNQIGVSFQKNGTLALDNAKLTTAINTDVSSVTRVLATVTSSNDPRISVVSTASTVSAGTYPININTAATRGNVAGNSAANLTITAGINDTLNFTVNGTAGSITLAPGTYTSAEALATEVSSKINAVSAVKTAGAAVTTSTNSGILSVYSTSYGSSSSFTITGGNGASDLFGASPTTTTGINVAGTLNSTSGTGSGQLLTSTTGLVIKADTTSTGTHGSITVARGIASRIDQFLTNFLGTSGSISSRIEGLNKSISSNTKQQEALSNRLTAIEKRYRAQYSALDASLTSLNQTSSYLTQQFNALLNSSSN